MFFGYRWEQVSHEIIRIEGRHLVIRREAQPFAAIHRSRTFDLAEIRDLRHDPLQPTPSLTIPSRAFGKGGEIAFEARDKTFRDTTFRFGLDLTIGDLDRIIEQLQLRIDRVVLK